MSNNSNSISRAPYEQPGLRFNDLFEEGIRLAQKFSGDHWTDYNYHDPGVTILEYLIYSLMDLSYRSSLPVEDLFLLETDSFDNIKGNLLYAPQDVFPSAPYTPEDYRKMIIDQIRHVRNAWVVPVIQDPSGYKGLYDIFVQAQDEMDERGERQLEKDIRQLFHEHRNLCHDLGKLNLLRSVPLTLEATIHLEADAEAELVLSKIFTELEQYINPEISMDDPFQLIAEGMPPEEVFNGPRPVHGYIHSRHLKPKTDSIYITRMRNIMANVEGVKLVSQLKVYRKGIPVYENQISFDAASYPSLEFRNFQSGQTHLLRILKNNIELEVDPITTQQLIDFDLAKRRTHYLRRLDYPHILPKGHFRKEELMEHFAVHNEFPENYGIGRQSLPASAPAEQQAQTRQLKAYLTIFEQFIANHLSQLAHIRNLMSIEEQENYTYFTQIPSDIDNLEDILQTNVATYEKFLQQVMNDPSEFADRRNRILDHLLARFGEKIDTDLLKKFRLQNGKQALDELNNRIIRTKIHYLQQIVSLSRSRNIAFNYLRPESWDSPNLSTLEKKLFLSLDFRHQTRRSLVKPLLTRMQMEQAPDAGSDAWKEQDITLAGTGVSRFLTLPAEQYTDEQIRFPPLPASFISRLCSRGTNPRYLRMLETGSPSDNKFIVAFSCMDESPDVVIFQHPERQICVNVMNRFMHNVREISEDCEGFHLVEHLLLRPLEARMFRFSILDEKGKVYLTGYHPGSLAQQSLLADELPLIGSKPENYSVVPEEDTSQFGVILYDANYQPVARLVQPFYSRVGAEKALEKAAAYLQKILSGKILLEQVLEINHASGHDLDIPQHVEFSNRVSIVLPAWPYRFSNEEFIDRLKQKIKEHLPAHFTADLYLLDPERMMRFEELFAAWLKTKALLSSTLSEVDLLSIRLLQFFEECKTSGIQA